MSTSLLMRAIVAAAALCAAPAIASAQAPTKPCKDGTSSSRSTFACWGHGGVDTSHAAEHPRAAAAKHHEAEPVQAGAPRAKHAKSTTHKDAKSSAHHAKTEHRDAHAAKKKQGEGHGWLPWRHKKGKEQDAKKPKKHKSTAHLPVPERPNGQPR